MARQTLRVPDDVLQRARIRARAEGTTVNAVVREHLETIAPASGPDGAERILAVSERSRASSGPAGRTWTRRDAYDRPSLL